MDAKQILRGDIDDLIFKDRNQEYGAYDIRKKYRERVNIALLIAVVFVVLVLVSPFISNWLFKSKEVVKEKEVVSSVNKLRQPPPREKLPPPPPDYKPPPPKVLDLRPPIVTKKEVIEKPIEKPDPKTIVDPNANKDNGKAVYDPGPQEPPKEIPKEIPTEPQEFGFDEDPQPQGGYDAYNKYLREHIKYPPQATDANVQGTVYITITIGVDGHLSDVKIKKDPVGYGCGEEAVRIIKTMTLSWTPGKMGGHAVKSRITVPVKFVLK